MLEKLSLCDRGRSLPGACWNCGVSPSEAGDRMEVDCEVELENDESDNELVIGRWLSRFEFRLIVSEIAPPLL